MADDDDDMMMMSENTKEWVIDGHMQNSNMYVSHEGKHASTEITDMPRHPLCPSNGKQTSLSIFKIEIAMILAIHNEMHLMAHGGGESSWGRYQNPSNSLKARQFIIEYMHI